MHSSRMHTTHLLVGGVYPPPDADPPECRPPQMQTPPNADPPKCRPPSVHRMTDRCKNLTLPKTSSAGGNKSQV